jgi:hypothetical protein
VSARQCRREAKEQETKDVTRIIDTREVAASMAAAFIAAMLFVSAAIGPLPIA